MVLMRWIHIASGIVLLGGFAFARLVLAPALAETNDSVRRAFADRIASRFRPILVTVVVTIAGSGLYNYLTKENYPPHYHMWIGIKFLFVMHIFAVAILYSTVNAEESKRNRWLTGMIASGLVIIAISAYLRWISLTGSH